MINDTLIPNGFFLKVYVIKKKNYNPEPSRPTELCEKNRVKLVF